jgi:hypothetical protein
MLGGKQPTNLTSEARICSLILSDMVPLDEEQHCHAKGCNTMLATCQPTLLQNLQSIRSP